MNIVCASCGLFVQPEDVNQVDKDGELFLQSIRSGIFLEDQLDGCGMKEDGLIIFCGMCFVSITAGQSPKFGHVNAVNTTCCHDFPIELEDLTLVEEAVIARAHPVISILKLRPASRASPDSIYRGIRGHAVVLPQNPGPLVDILPSSTFQVEDIIRVIWASDKPYTEQELRPFLTVRKHKVQAVGDRRH